MMQKPSSLMMLCFVFVGLFAAQLVSPATAWADNVSFPVQGYIIDSETGTALTGEFDVTFNFYPTCSSDTTILQEVQTVVFSNGVYNTSILLAETDVQNILGTEELCLGIQIGSDDELSPRVEYHTTPYALAARSAQSATVANTALSIASSNLPSFLDDITGAGLTVSGDTITLDTTNPQSWSGEQTYSEQVTIQEAPESTGSENAALLINPGSTSLADSQFFAIQDNGTDRFTVDKEGDVSIAGNLTLSGLPNCDTLDTNSSGQIICGTDDSSGDTNLVVETLKATTSLSFEDPSALGTETITFTAPTSLSGSYNLEWPTDDGTSGQVLTTDGGGLLSWSSPNDGDITAINTNSGSALTGGATSGDITLQVAVDNTSVEINSNQLRVKDGGISNAKVSDVAAGKITGSLSDAQVSNTLTVGASGSVDDAALSANVSLLGTSIESSEITDGTIANADIADVAASKITGELSDAQVSDTLTVGSSGSVDDAALSANVSLLGTSIESAEITDGTVTASDLNATLTFLDGDLLNLSAIDASSALEGLILPQNTDVSSATAEGQLSWDADDDVLYIGDGSSTVAISNPFGSAIESVEITDGTIADADIADVAASKITGELSDAQVSNTLTVGSSGSVDDAALSANVSLLGSSIESAEITDGTIADADIADVAAGKITGSLSDAQVSDTLTIGSAGSVDDAALSANVSLLGSSIESAEITDGTIANADIADVAASKVTGELSDAQVSDTLTVGSSGSIDDAALSANVSLLGTSIESSEITDGTVTTSDLNATLTFLDGDLLNLSAIDVSSALEGLILPQNTDVSSATAEGQLSWDTDDDVLYIGDGSSTVAVSNPFGSTIESAEITDGTITDADIADVAASKITGELSDAQVSDTLTIGSSGSVDDAALSANVSLLGTSIESSEITDGTIVDADVSDVAAGKITGTLSDAQVSNTLTVGASGSVDDAALSANVSLLGTSIESSEITDGTIANADIADVAASKITGELSDAQVSDTLTVGSSGSVDDAALSANVSLLGTSIESAEITDGTVTASDLNATLTFVDSDLLNLSAINASSTSEGFILPQNTDVSAATAEGQLSWDTDDDVLYIGDGSSTVAVSNPFGSAIESVEITDGTIADADIADVAASKITGELSDAQVSDTLTIGSSGSVDDVALSANVSLLGSSIESAEITDGTIVDADVSDIAAGKITGTLSDAQISNTLTVGASGSVDDAALSANVSLLGSSIESSEITDGTIANADIADVAASKITGELSDAQISDTLTVGSSGSVDDAALSANVSLLGTSIESSEITDGTVTASDLNATLTFLDGDLLNLSAIDASSALEGFILPQNTDVSSATAEGQLSWDTDDDILYIGDGSSIVAISNPFGSTIESAEITDGTIVDADIADVAASKITGELSDAQVSDTLTIGSSGSVNDSALSANVSLLGSSIESAEITDGTIVDVDIADVAAGKITGTLSDAQVSNTLTVGSSGSVDDAALSANVSLLGTSIESSEITDGTIANADIADIAASKVTGELSDAQVSDTLTVGSSGSIDDAALSANVSLLGTSIESAEITDGTITASDLNATLTFLDGDLLNLSAIDASSALEGLILPQNTDVSSATAEGQLSWDTDDDVLYIGDGSSTVAVSNPFGSTIESAEITDGTIADADIADVAASKITGELSDAQVSNTLTVGSSGSVDDAALSANVSLLGTSIESAEITDGTIVDADISDVAAGKITGTLSDAQVSNTLTIGASGSVDDAALSANVSLLGSSIESSEITDGTIANADIADVAASKITGELSDAQVSDTLTVGSSGSVDDAALSANVSLLGTSIESAEITNGTVTASDLNATLTFVDSDLLNLSAIDASSTLEGFILPQNTDVSSATAEGQLSWDTDDDVLYIGDGSSTVAVSNPFGSAIESVEITDGTITDADIADVAASKITGELSDAQVSNTLTVGSSGSVDDAALSANVSLLGATIESAEITDGTIVDADVSDVAAGKITGSLSDAQISNTLTVGSAGSVDDAALSANVSLLGTSIESSEITDGTIANADIADVAASKITGELSDAQVSDTLTVGSSGSVDDAALSANVSLLGTSIESAEITDGTITASDLNTTLTFVDSDLLNLSAINASSTSEGFMLPQNTDVSAATAEGQLSWDTDDDVLYVGDGSSTVAVSNPFGSAIESVEITDGTIADADIADVAASKITGELSDAQVSNTLTVGSSGSVDDAALSANVSLLGSSIESAEITDGTIIDADVSDIAAGKITGTLSDAQISNTLTVGASGSIDDAALSANVSLLGSSIESSEITDGTIANADIADIAASKITGELSDAQVSDTLTVGSSGSVDDAALSANVSLLGTSIESAEITDGTITASDLNATLTFLDGDLLNLSAVDASSALEGFILPQNTDVSSATAEGQLSWDTDDNVLYIGDGSSTVAVSNPFGSTIESVEITDGTITDADIADVAASKITGELSDAQVSDTLTIGSSGSVNDSALSANVSLLGSSIESAEITDGTIADVDIADVAAGKITGTLSDAQVSNTLTVGSSGSIDDAALSANVSLLGTSIESSEITDGTIANADIADVAASKITGELSDTQVSDTLTIGSSGSIDDAALSANVSLLGTSIESAEITDGTLTTSDLNATLTFLDGDLLNLSAIDVSSALEGFILPQNTDVSSATAEGQLSWDSDDDILYIGDGSSTVAVSNPFGSTIESAEITDGTITDADIADVAASKITGELSDAQVSNTLTVGSSGSVDDAALSANVSLLGSSIESAEITDGTIADADIADVAASKITGELSDAQVSNTLTVGSSGSVDDAALSANVSLLGTSIESSEITDGTIVDADVSDVAAEKITGTLSDAQISNTLTVGASGSINDAALSANVSLLGTSIESAEITDGTVTASDLNATLTFLDGDLLNLSAIDASSALEGFILPQNTDVSSATAEGQLSWDTDDDVLYIGDGSSTVAVSNPFGSAIESAEITDGTIADADIADVSASKITGELSDAQVSNTLTVGSSGSVDDAALSANVSLLGATIESAEITDGTIVDADVSDVAAGKITGSLSDAQISNTLTVGSAGSVDDAALSANVSLLGTSIESSEITDGTIANADIADVAASKITGELSDAQVSDTLTVGSSGSVDDAALSANVSLLGTSIESSEITDGTIANADIADVAASKITGELSDAQVSDTLTVGSSGSIDDAALSANVSLLGISIESSEITDGTVTTSDLNATLTFVDSDLLNLSAINASSTSEGFILPQNTDVSAATAEGQLSWDTDDDVLYIGDGSSTIAVSNPFGSAIESVEITDGTIADADIADVAASKITGELSDAQVSNTLTVGSSGSVDDAALSSNVSLLGAAIESSEITDNTVTASDLNATLTFADGDLIDLSNINGSATSEGLLLPQATSTTSSTAEGQITWDTDDDQLFVGTGSGQIDVSGDITAVTAGDGLTGGATSGEATLDIDLLSAADGSGATSSSSGLEFAGTGSDELALIQGCDNGEILKWSDSTSEWACAADAGLSSIYEVYDDSGSAQSFTGTAITVSLDTEREANPNYSLASNIVTVNSDGLYKITYTCSTDMPSGSSRSGSRCFIAVNGTTEVDGSTCYIYNRSSTTGEGACTRSVVQQLSDTDTVRLMTQRVSGSATLETVIDDSSMMIEKFHESGADLAEIYYTKDYEISAGDVVSIDPQIEAGVSQSQKAYDAKVLGVIATKPGLVMGAHEVNSPHRPVLVALTGRVPVKVTDQNGPIKVGDPLVASNKPGYAMKAIEAGYSIGKAITEHTKEGTGTIMAFVDATYFGGQNTKVTGTSTTNHKGYTEVLFDQSWPTKPKIQLTVESHQLSFVQISEFLRDENDDYAGFVIKSYQPNGESAPETTVHYTATR